MSKYGSMLPGAPSQITYCVDLKYPDFLQVFFVVLMFYSPLPKHVKIERRKTATSIWELWQYYSENCDLQYNLPNNGPLNTSTSVNCIKLDM